MSQITTHILDTSIGKPAKGIQIQLQKPEQGNWTTIAEGHTNDDGRISDLLEKDKPLIPGNYRMIFDTGTYFKNQNIQGFYPDVTIHFTISDNSHYHIPLLLNPFGYTTYRGS